MDLSPNKYIKNSYLNLKPSKVEENTTGPTSPLLYNKQTIKPITRSTSALDSDWLVQTR